MARKATHPLTTDKTLLHIMSLLKTQGKTEKELLLYLGLSGSTFTKWKYRGCKSYVRYLGEIALFLGVDEEELAT